MMGEKERGRNAPHLGQNQLALALGRVRRMIRHRQGDVGVEARLDLHLRHQPQSSAHKARERARETFAWHGRESGTAMMSVLAHAQVESQRRRVKLRWHEKRAPRRRGQRGRERTRTFSGFKTTKTRGATASSSFRMQFSSTCIWVVIVPDRVTPICKQRSSHIFTSTGPVPLKRVIGLPVTCSQKALMAVGV